MGYVGVSEGAAIRPREESPNHSQSNDGSRVAARLQLRGDDCMSEFVAHRFRFDHQTLVKTVSELRSADCASTTDARSLAILMVAAFVALRVVGDDHTNLPAWVQGAPDCLWEV